LANPNTGAVATYPTRAGKRTCDHINRLFEVQPDSVPDMCATEPSVCY